MESIINSPKTEDIHNVLKSVIDPEIGLNIIDLGLIYSIKLDGGKNIIINMTLTSPGCPMGDIILNDVNEILEGKFPEYKIQINLVWDPAWSNNMISVDGKQFLGY